MRFTSAHERTGDRKNKVVHHAAILMYLEVGRERKGLGCCHGQVNNLSMCTNTARAHNASAIQGNTRGREG